MKNFNERRSEVREKLGGEKVTGYLACESGVTDHFDVWVTDAGRSKSGLRETNDCTVRATATALDIPYLEAHAKLAAIGRKPRRGISYRTTTEKLGLEHCPEYSGTLKTVIAALAPGRYVLRKARHVFAVVDGVVVDSFLPNPRCRIKAVYRVK